MFRDLKEYQEIAKIYADKVSKPENLEERRGSSPEQLAQNRKDAFKPATPPQKGAGGGVGNPTNPRGTGTAAVKFEKPTGAAKGRTRRPEIKKPLPTTAEIRAKNPNVVPGTRVNEVGAKGGGKPSSGDLSMFKDDKPKVSTMTKQGKPRTKAQMMAAKRIAAGKTIQQVKDENKASMKAKASERNQKFQAAKKSGNLAQFRKDNPKLSGRERAQQMAKDRLAKKAAMEEFTPYDFVLEYLLSTEQVATIEEANYVMTEMDAETIQGIVEEQKKNLEEGLPLLAKGAMMVGGAVLAKKGLDKAKKGFDNYINKQRDKGIGGNTRPGSDKIYYGK